MRQNIACLQQASYCAALVEQTTEAETPLPGIFELMRGFLDQLSAQPPQTHAIFAFELKLLDDLGLTPDLEKARLTPGAKQAVLLLAREDWPVVTRLKLSTQQIAEIRDFLRGFLVYHLERIPSSRAAALAPR